MALYKNFRVIRSRARVIANSDSSSAGAAQNVIVLRASTGVGATMSTFSDAICTANSKFAVTGAVYSKPIELSMERSTASMLDLSPDSPSLVGTASADPTVQWVWYVHVASMDEATASYCNFIIWIEYDVEFSGRITLAQS
jgi:hypothetical protein